MALGADIPMIALFVTDLPEPGLADDGKSFAFVKVEIYAAHGLHFSCVRAEGDTQIFNFEFLFHISPPIL